MKRPKKTDYIKRIAEHELKSDYKSYSQVQDKYIDYLERAKELDDEHIEAQQVIIKQLQTHIKISN